MPGRKCNYTHVWSNNYSQGKTFKNQEEEKMMANISATEVTKVSPISFMERVKLWAKIPGTAQHETLTREAFKGCSSQTIICYKKGPAFDAAIFVNDGVACIRNKSEGLDTTVALSILRSKLAEVTSWVEARWIILNLDGTELRIKKDSLAAVLQRFE